MVPRFAILAACAFAFAAQVRGAQTPIYQLRALAMYSQTTKCAAWGLNDSGQIVGSGGRFGPDRIAYPLRWTPSGAVSRVGTLWDYDQASANAIDNSGNIVGGVGFSAFYRQANGFMITVPMRVAYDINSRNQVSGFTGTCAGVWHPSGTLTRLGMLSGYEWAYGRSINDSGQVAGYAAKASTGESRALMWTPAGARVLLPLPGMESFSSASDINSSGQIAGSVDWTAVVWEPNLAMRRLSAPPGQIMSEAWGINDSGWVVGCARGSGGRDAPVVWTPDSVQIPLPMLAGCDWGVASKINRFGQIVGHCGSSITYQVYPVTWVIVPEPSSIAVLLCGFGALGGVVWRRKH